MQIRTKTMPDRHLLVSRAWALSDAGGAVLQPRLFLTLDGRVAGLSGARGPSMHRWDVDDGRLVVADRAGRATVRFDGPAEDDDRPSGDGSACVRLEGRTTAGAVLWLVELETTLDAVPGGLAARLVGLRGTRARRNLVVLHAGAGSAHADWPHDVDVRDRNWDLCIVWHDDADGHADDPDAQAHVVQHGVSKWPALLALAGASSPLECYDHVMAIDDDLDWSWSSVNLAFGIARDHDLLLAHPAFDPAGRVDRPAARVDAMARLRFATTIPTGAVLFSRDALAACSPTFAGGLDEAALAAAWVARLGRPLHRIAILDETPIRARARAAPGSAEGGSDDLAIVGSIDRHWPAPGGS